MRNKKAELFWAIFSVAAGAAYTLLSELFTTEPFIDTFTYGLILALLIELVVLLVTAVISLSEIHELAAGAATAGGKARESILNLSANIEFARNLLMNIQSSRDKLLQDSAHLLQRDTMLGHVGVQTLKGYLADLRVSQYGFSLNGEYWSLRTYIELWKKLVEAQGEAGTDPERLIIARITHSNDIRLWRTMEVPEAHALLALQRDFVRLGGIIVRIFLGPTQEAPPEYRQVMESMERFGIDARYVWREMCPDFAFDFLYLHDEGIAAKWYAGAGGRILSHIELTDQVESQIKERWIALAELTEDKEGPMSRIPEKRQIWPGKAARAAK